jgi:uncharacterized protein with PIN domain
VSVDSFVPHLRQLNCNTRSKPKGRIDFVRKTVQEQYIYSKPTMCLHCHLVVEMVHERDADPQKGAWTCPRCGHIYPFQHWKIRKQGPRKAEAA